VSNPSIGSGLWSELVDLNKHADALISRVVRAIEPSQPIQREIPFFASIEARFDQLPSTFAAATPASSDALAGNNVKQSIFTNHSSRVYVREIAFQPYLIRPTTPIVAGSATYDARLAAAATAGVFPFNWRWNFQTSIQQRWYSQKGRCFARAGGRTQVGNHLSFRNPQIIEPMETFTFECELLGAGMRVFDTGFGPHPSAVVAMLISGYREGG